MGVGLEQVLFPAVGLLKTLVCGSTLGLTTWLQLWTLSIWGVGYKAVGTSLGALVIDETMVSAGGIHRNKADGLGLGLDVAKQTVLGGAAMIVCQSHRGACPMPKLTAGNSATLPYHKPGNPLLQISLLADPGWRETPSATRSQRPASLLYMTFSHAPALSYAHRDTERVGSGVGLNACKRLYANGVGTIQSRKGAVCSGM